VQPHRQTSHIPPDTFTNTQTISKHIFQPTTNPEQTFPPSKGKQINQPLHSHQHTTQTPHKHPPSQPLSHPLPSLKNGIKSEKKIKSKNNLKFSKFFSQIFFFHTFASPIFGDYFGSISVERL
jgi:hypothetical protein